MRASCAGRNWGVGLPKKSGGSIGNASCNSDDSKATFYRGEAPSNREWEMRNNDISIASAKLEQKNIMMIPPKYILNFIGTEKLSSTQTDLGGKFSVCLYFRSLLWQSARMILLIRSLSTLNALAWIASGNKAYFFYFGWLVLLFPFDFSLRTVFFMTVHSLQARDVFQWQNVDICMPSARSLPFII